MATTTVLVGLGPLEGGGWTTSFASVTEGVDAAVAAQRAARSRIGVHVGDEQAATEAVARCLADGATTGQILVSDVVRLLVDGREVETEPAEPVEVPGLAHGVAAWSLCWTPAADVDAIRVVVAEDSVLVRAGLVRLLREEGFVVVAEAGDRDELLAAARTHRPDLVVTDVRMPPTQSDEGITAAATLRDEDPDVAVLVLSQHVEPAAAALLLAATPTAVGYLLKERVSHLDEFIGACRSVAAGDVVIDPLVTERLLSHGGRDDALTRLTDREREVLDLMAQGRSNAAIAREMHCAAKTLESHVRSIFTKLDMPENPDDHRRVAAVVRWLHASRDGG